nr:fimbrillin family protein [uncultured Bacteroides sp.]
MKTIYKTLSMVLLASLVAGCDNGSDADLPADALVPVRIVDAGISAEVQTRATISSGSMGVFRAAANGYTAQYNSQYTYNGGWKPNTTVYVGGANATLYAYYPYNAATFTANSTTCTLTAQKYDATKDLCYASTGGSSVCNKTPNASFAMTRAYARLKLSITRHATNYVGNCNITDVNLKNSSGSNFFVSRTLDISSGANGGSATAGGWTYALNSGNIAANATNTAYDVLVPPQPVSGNLTITLTIDGVNRAINIPAAQFTSNNLAVGRQYTIALTITDTAVTPGGNVAITDMTTDGTDIKNDTPTEI